MHVTRSGSRRSRWACRQLQLYRLPLVGGPGYEAADFGAYAEVSRALAPYRDQVIGWDEETLRWMQRFDALPPSRPSVQELEVPLPKPKKKKGPKKPP